ncbi:MAG: LD-carboxypeptidase, partial [Urechidicola sp.]|nr:LD-carboxypeptidase [Urechidicola sp.]
KATGVLVGGNLSILYSLLGSKSAINTDGKILFIEDFNEYLYHIDRMIVALKRNGMFKKLNGLIVGGLTQLHDNEVAYGKNIEEIILNNLSEYDFPICFDFPAGHIDDNNALVLGATIKLKVDDIKTEIKFN